MKEAAEYRERALELRPDYTELWRNTWLTFMRAGEFANATQALVNWAAGSGRDVDRARQLGHILEQSQSSGEMAQFPEELLTNLAIGNENLSQVYRNDEGGEPLSISLYEAILAAVKSTWSENLLLAYSVETLCFRGQFEADRHKLLTQRTANRRYRLVDPAHQKVRDWLTRSHLNQPVLGIVFDADGVGGVDRAAHEGIGFLAGVEGINSKYLKKYDPPRTPYDRVLASDQITDEAKERLKTVHQSLNPFILKKTIEKKLRVIFKHVKVTSNVRQRI